MWLQKLHKFPEHCLWNGIYYVANEVPEGLSWTPSHSGSATKYGYNVINECNNIGENDMTYSAQMIFPFSIAALLI